MKDGSIEGLSKLLEPYSPEEFLDSVWGRTHKHVEGWQGKFAALLPWNQLSEILTQHRLDFPRLRLARDGKSLPASSYLRYTSNSRQRTNIPRLLSSALTAELRDGATLVIDAVDEFTKPLRTLAESLEYHFHEHIQINAYAGWHSARGFDLHFDDHDVFILQVAGRKRWKLYGMTRPYPLGQDRDAIEKPAAEPLWENTLEDGDLLYIPRGWWHVAEPLAEPTLHLTVGVHNRTGIDLLRWVTERMTKSAAFRKDLPRFSTASERQAHIDELRRELAGALDDQVLQRFFDDQDAQAPSRPHVDLPWSVAAQQLIPADPARIRLTSPRPLTYKVEEGVLSFTANKKLWRVAPDTVAIFRLLENRRVCSVIELSEAVRGKLDAQTVKTFIGEMIFHGLVTVDSHS